MSQPYPNARYTHSGWWTEDGRYLFVHDELDERDFNLNTTVRVFDMANLRAPVLAGSWVGPTRAIDHNGYVRGNRYYFSNYSEGLTVLDITNPATPTRVGFFDTFPATAEARVRRRVGHVSVLRQRHDRDQRHQQRPLPGPRRDALDAARCVLRRQREALGHRRSGARDQRKSQRRQRRSFRAARRAVRDCECGRRDACFHYAQLGRRRRVGRRARR